jgi:hypothetical protein
LDVARLAPPEGPIGVGASVLEEDVVLATSEVVELCPDMNVTELSGVCIVPGKLVPAKVTAGVDWDVVCTLSSLIYSVNFGL